jgi:AcrR family transcriptional regulator
MEKPSYKERAREQREREIIETAHQLMNEKGFAHFNMEEVAERVGISKPTLYQHFESREALIVTVIVWYFHDLQAKFTQAKDQPPLEQIKYILRLMMKGRYKAGAIFQHFNPEFINLLRSNEQLGLMRERTFQHFTDLIDQGKTEGQIRKDLPTTIISSAMFCLQGALGHHLHEAQDEVNVDENIEHVISLLIQGIQAWESK